MKTPSKRQLKKAVAYLDEANEYLDEARSEHKRGNFDGAIHLIDKAINLLPSVSLYWTVKASFLIDSGSADEGNGRFQEAKVVLKKAIENDRKAKNYHAWTLCGELDHYLGRHEQAAANYKESIKIKETFEVYTMLASVEREFDLDSAIQHAQRALELNPDWEEAEEILESAREMKKRKEAGQSDK